MPGKRVSRRITVDKPVWDSWGRGEIRPIEFEGVKFDAVLMGALLYAGEKLAKNSFSGYNGTLLTMNTATLSVGGAGSCAYGRIYPMGGTELVLKCWKWFLYNVKLERGHIAYLTKLDVDNSPTRLAEVQHALKRRGFKEVSCNNSIHAGGYPVWLYVHPGDSAIMLERANKKNKNKAVKSDVLGNTDASVPQPGVTGNPVAGNAAAPVVPDAYAIAA